MSMVLERVTDQELKDAIKSKLDLHLNGWERIVDISMIYFPSDTEKVYISVITITDSHLAFKTSYVFYVNNYNLEYISTDGVI